MEKTISDQQLLLLINDLLESSGYDFRGYTKASLKRRVNRLYGQSNYQSFSEFRNAIRFDKQYFDRFAEQIMVNVTEMFRDPSFFRAIKEEIFPVLGTYPLIRIWHAGCSTGEEVYAMAILLKEANLLHKSILYATDLSAEVIKKAASGIFPMKYMQQYSDNYHQAGGTEEFSKYYRSGYDHVLFNEELRSRMVFSTHNLVSESSFNHFQLIMCRNVLIYFDKELQDKVFLLFMKSLDQLGFLALGSKESLKFSTEMSRFDQVSKEKIYRKMN